MFGGLAGTSIVAAGTDRILGNTGFIEVHHMATRDSEQTNRLVEEYLRRGNGSCRDQLWDRCVRYLWAVYRKSNLSGLDDDVEFLGWQAFEEALEEFDEQRNFLSFLGLVFISRCIDAVRREVRRREFEVLESDLAALVEESGEGWLTWSEVGADFQADPAQVAARREMLSQVEEAVRQMSDPSREAVEDRIEGLSYAAIEQRQGGSAKDLIYHDRVKAKEFLRKEHGWEL